MGKFISGIYKQNDTVYPARQIGEALPRKTFVARLRARPILERQGSIWILHCLYDQRDIAKSHGFHWAPDRKQWWTDSPKKAVKLISFANAPTKRDLLDRFA